MSFISAKHRLVFQALCDHTEMKKQISSALSMTDDQKTHMFSPLTAEL